MSVNTAVDPVSLLKDYETRCKASAAVLPQGPELCNEWSGVAFRIGSNQLLASLGQVVEILPCPEMTVVPNTCSWLSGIANIRGKLLPVVDLNEFLGQAKTEVTYRSRVLVIDYHGVYSGVLVDEVLGLKHFPLEDLSEDCTGVDGHLMPYVNQGYRVDGRYWCVFSLSVLAEAPHFLQTAV